MIMPYLYVVSWTPPPGTIGLTCLHGFPALRAAFGHRILNDPSSYNHAFVVLNDGLVAEAWPTGARVVPLTDFDGEVVAYGWLPGLATERQQDIVAAAIDLLGVGHSIFDYLALARYRRQRSLNRRLIRLVTSADRLLPAQFVTEAYQQAGVHLLTGQNRQDVTMEELARLFLESPQWELRVPCTQYV